MAKIAVTGCAGFIGGHVTEKLLSEGHDILGIDCLTYAGNRELIRKLKREYENFSFLRLNIGSVFGWDLDDVDMVVNMAAETHVDNSIKDSFNFVSTNIVETHSLLDMCSTMDIPLLHFSTDEVYGVSEDGSFDEDTPLNPQNPYSASKAAADLLIQSYQNTHKTRATIFRPSNNFGPRQNREKFIPTIAHSIMSGKKIPIYNKGQEIREWTYVEHTASATSFMCDQILNGNCLGEIYNLSSSNEMKNIDLVEKLCKLLEVDFESSIEFVPDRPGHDFRYSVNSSKLSKLGFNRPFDLERELTKTMKYYSEELV